MLTGENKGKIDKVWNTFWSGRAVESYGVRLPRATRAMI